LSKTLYPGHWRVTLEQRTHINPIAVPGGGPAMRGGAFRAFVPRRRANKKRV